MSPSYVQRHLRWRAYCRPWLAGVLFLMCSFMALWTFFRQSTVQAQRDVASLYPSHFDHQSQPETQTPTLHKHRWNITKEYRYPDGVQKLIYLINGQFPGPTLEVISGDKIVVVVINSLENEGVSIHWHGIHMRGSPDMDGAVGFTQCSIPPGGEFEYSFDIIDQAGTFWYHGHSELQRGDGLYGGLIVHEQHDEESHSDRAEHSFDEEHLLMIGDWYHRPAHDILDDYMSNRFMGNEPVPDSLVVNGQGFFKCDMAVPARPVVCKPAAKPFLHLKPGARHRVRVINTGTLAGFSLAFQGASIKVLEVDGGTKVQDEAMGDLVGILYPGERVDLLVIVNQKSENAPCFSVILDDENFRFINPTLTSTQVFSLTNSDREQFKQFSPSNSSRRKDLAQMTSIMPSNLPQNSDQTFVLYVNTLILQKNRNIPWGFMNHTSWRPQQQPLMAAARKDWDANQFVPSTGPKPVWIDIVVNNLDDASHPFHLHGHDFFVLSTYASHATWGAYDPFTMKDPPGGAYNILTPIKKDTVSVPMHGYVVLRFLADNRGVWMFHCHIMWHMASGMAMGFDVLDSYSNVEVVQRVKNSCVRN